MERDGVIAHGMSTFLYDSLMNRGDAYKVAICNHTGTLAIYNKETDHFYSPLVDGPIKYDVLDKSTYIPNLITKYGKEFSIVEIPYSFKLLMQELTSMNVQMRLITADNIEQLTKEGDRRIYERDLQSRSPENNPAEDIFERLKRENENKIKLERKLENENENTYGEPELLTSEEKTQILNMPQQKIKAFIEGHNVSDLTPIQKKQFAKIIGTSKHYMRLEQELSDNDLYKVILSDEIDKIFEPTNSERALYKEIYGENLNNDPQGFRPGTTFGGQSIDSVNEVSSDKMIVQKEDYQQSGGNESELASSELDSSELESSQLESVPAEAVESGTKVIKI
jgi:hypothetical protein